MVNRLPDLFSYIVDTDNGFAPNPFGGICTLVCCKPKIRRNANIGDWIIGTTPSPEKGRLVYAMKINRSLTLDLYWNDPEYECKKPNKNNVCGDNIYKNALDGGLVQIQNLSHSERNFEKDPNVNRALISKTFYYFGKEAPEIPKQFKSIIHIGQGHKRLKPTLEKYDAVSGFLVWLKDNFNQGVNGYPAHIKARCNFPIPETYNLPIIE